MKLAAKLLAILLIILNTIQALADNGNTKKSRLLILTDIGGDPDDIQSMRRLLLYSNEFRIEGLVATSTLVKGTIGTQAEYRVYDSLIHLAIDDYAKVLPQLQKHAAGFPSTEYLHQQVFRGQPVRSVDSLKAGLSTPGSRHIIDVVDAGKELLHISIWGGAHDLAQALLDVRSSRTKEETNDFVSRLRIYAINDQDKKFHPHGKGTGEWIRANFPQLWYIEAGPTWMNVFSACYRGMYQNDAAGGSYETIRLVPPGIEKMNQMAWLKTNVFPKGALGAGYPAGVGQNPRTNRNTQGVKEGDTPSWFYFLVNGLSDPEHPEWGCWGGRFEHDVDGHFVDAQDNHWTGSQQSAVRRKWTVARWREAYQNDFAGRMQWCISDYNKANHNPLAVIDNDKSKAIIYKDIEAGQSLLADATSSTDPDSNAITFKWWIYQEASSSTAILKVPQKGKVQVETSALSPKGEIHLILEVQDNGKPALTSYRRIVIRVK